MLLVLGCLMLLFGFLTLLGLITSSPLMAGQPFNWVDRTPPPGHRYGQVMAYDAARGVTGSIPARSASVNACAQDHHAGAQGTRARAEDRAGAHRQRQRG